MLNRKIEELEKQKNQQDLSNLRPRTPRFVGYWGRGGKASGKKPLPGPNETRINF